jgi:hypothetical protein
MFTDTRRLAGKPSRRQLAAVDREIERIYYRVAGGVQIDVMDIGKVFEAGHAAAAGGEAAIEAAIVAIVAQLRKN